MEEEITKITIKDLHNWREIYLKEKVDWATVEPKKNTIDFVLRSFINWLKEKV